MLTYSGRVPASEAWLRELGCLVGPSTQADVLWLCDMILRALHIQCITSALLRLLVCYISPRVETSAQAYKHKPMSPRVAHLDAVR